MNADFFNTYYYTTNNPWNSYAQKNNTLGPVVSLTLNTLNANLSRYITVVATHRGQQSWLPQQSTPPMIQDIQELALDSDSLEENTTLGNRELIEDSTIKIYPNPFNNQITIINPYRENLILQWMTVDGKFIREDIVESNFKTLNTSQLSKGFYLVKVLRSNLFINTYKLQK